MPDRQNNKDSELIKQARQGDTDAFGEIYECYAPAIFRYLYSHLDNRLDAEDLTEEVFLRTWQSLPRYRDKGVPFLAYVFRIARNALVDHYRRQKKPQPELFAEYSTSILDLSPGPAEIYSDKIEQQELHLMLNQLREDYRTVLILRFITGLSPNETAQIMDRSEGAVRVLQHRALSKLRKLVDGNHLEQLNRIEYGTKRTET
jgi:RNA polymerase sigma-70 factor (ECF subfamily)